MKLLKTLFFTGTAFGIFLFLNLIASKAYACNSGLSRLDPTCPGGALNLQPPTPGQDIDGYPLYYIQAKHSGQCLNVLDSSLSNGAPVVQGARCNTDNFKWALISVK